MKSLGFKKLLVLSTIFELNFALSVKIFESGFTFSLKLGPIDLSDVFAE
jgi:hypothetical protein